MNNQIIRQRRITDLYKYALTLAKDNTQTYDSIKSAIMSKALLTVSKSTAMQYTDSVFNMINIMRKLN